MIRAVAGPEMDAAVAEHVMGWIYHPPSADTEGIAWWEVPEGDPTRDGFGSADWPPRYSTDIADAWLVVERMGTEVKLRRVSDHMYYVRFGAHTGAVPGADTAPLAICIAALKANGVNVE